MFTCVKSIRTSEVSPVVSGSTLVSSTGGSTLFAAAWDGISAAQQSQKMKMYLIVSTIHFAREPYSPEASTCLESPIPTA